MVSVLYRFIMELCYENTDFKLVDICPLGLIGVGR